LLKCFPKHYILEGSHIKRKINVFNLQKESVTISIKTTQVSYINLVSIFVIKFRIFD
jgi:hypothetical protein